MSGSQVLPVKTQEGRIFVSVVLFILSVWKDCQVPTKSHLSEFQRRSVKD
jgi:hypothetical protein